MGEWRYSSTLVNLGTSLRRLYSFTPQSLYPRERAPGTHWIGGWVGPITGLDDAERWKFLTLQGLELRSLGSPARRQSLYRLICLSVVINVIKKIPNILLPAYVYVINHKIKSHSFRQCCPKAVVPKLFRFTAPLVYQDFSTAPKVRT
jgi:hypothetical protein